MDNLFICNIKDADIHCKMQCSHGKPHDNEGCSSYQFCDIVQKRTKCRKLFKREIKIIRGSNEFK